VKFSKDVVLFCHITTQIEGEKNGDLLEKKGGQGFPYIIYMDAQGAVLAEHQGDRSAEGFAKTGKAVKDYSAAKARVDKGEKGAGIELAIAELILGKATATDAEKKIQAAGTPTKEQQALIDTELLNAKILEEVRSIESDAAADAVGKKYYEILKTGKPAPTGEQAMQPFYMLAMRAASTAKDAATFEKALEALKKKFGHVPNAKRFFEENEKKLEELKKK
jgi:hypothetical protein